MRAKRMGGFLLGAAWAGARGWGDEPGPVVTADNPWRALFHSRAITLYTENDKYFAGSDRDYTNGFKLSFLGDTNLDDSPGFVKAVARFIPTLPSPVAGRQDYKVGASIGQNIYTPTDIHTATPDPADRPYSAWLYAALTFQAEDKSPDRVHDLLRVVELDFGVVGPAAIGKQIQNGVHSLLGIPHAEGWAHQLHNEPGLVLSWERRYRVLRTPPDSIHWRADLLGRGGLALGNVDTSAQLGVMARAGWKVPRDFGPDLIRAAGGGETPAHNFSFYLFGGAEGRAIGRSIFLDGNTWQSSPSVNKRPLVADAYVGLVLRIPARLAGMRGFQLVYSENYRTKEFYGQPQRDVFGSIGLTVLY